MVLKEIDYKNVFTYFEEISNIPRGSYNNQKISDYLVEFAKKHSLEYIQDEALNVVIKKPGSKGMEQCAPVILQGHMDMVCEKDSDVSHDFETEGLVLIVEGDFVKAKGTTLGADDGIALAYILAVFSSDEFVHPPLEAIITTDEEVGMLGAAKINLSKMNGKCMLNIDSEEEGIFLTSCAGGLTGCSTLPVKYIKKSGKKLGITISGLKGGHSGTEIHKHRTNASKLLGRLLQDLSFDTFDVITLSGGQKDNVITREASVELLVSEQSFENKINEKFEIYQKELMASEPDLFIQIMDKGETSESVLEKECFSKILFLLDHAPQGVQVMSAEIDDLVESSLNLGILSLNEKEACFGFSVRSSKGSYKEYISNKLKNITEMTGGKYEVKGDYPAWEYLPDSLLRQVMCEVYEKMYGKKPIVQALHAGLECGIVASKIEGVDIVSFGPDIFDIHTSKERLSISSTIRVFDFMLEVLSKLCEI